MFTRDTKKIETKIEKIFKSASSEPNKLGIEIQGCASRIIGMDTNDPDGLSILTIFKSSEGVHIQGNLSSKSFAYSSIEGCTANDTAKKYIAINARKKETIKFYYLDSNGFGKEISASSPLEDGEMVMCFIETNGEIIYLIASSDLFGSGYSIALTSSTSAESMNFLRITAFEILNIISPETFKEISMYFKVQV